MLKTVNDRFVYHLCKWGFFVDKLHCDHPEHQRKQHWQDWNLVYTEDDGGKPHHYWSSKWLTSLYDGITLRMTNDICHTCS